MAHLAHKLPWNTLASRLELVRDHTNLTSRYTDLFLNPDSEQQLSYFLEAFGNVIREFAATERKKYPANMNMPDKGPLFPSSLWESALPYMENQDLTRHGHNTINLHDAERIENWIVNAGQIQRSTDNSWNEAVAFLLTEGHMEPLLKLAKHPKIHLDILRECPGNYQSGYSLMVADTLKAYICLNLIFCKPELWSEGKREHLALRSFRLMLSSLQESYSGDLVYLHQRKYVGYPPRDDFDPFLNLNEMRDYLKECFLLLVRYEMVEREAGCAPDWNEIFAWMESYSTAHRTSLFNIGRWYRETREGNT